MNGPARHDAARIVVVGGGAAGVLAAIHLLRAAGEAGAALDVTVVEPDAELGRGVAYSTADRRHLLNVPAGAMSAFPDRPDDFVDWRCRNGCARSSAAGFAARIDYGRYLRATLAAAVPAFARLEHLRTTVESCRPSGRGLLLSCVDGTELQADAVVLATGLRPPGTGWAPAGLTSSGRFVRDPWAPGALDAIEADADVLLVGTGLTMVDVAVTLADPRRVLHAVSRRGRVPAAHTSRPAARLAGGDELRAAAAGLELLDADRVRALVRDTVRAGVRECGDWRAAFDALRPLTQRLWSQLDDADRRALLTDVPWWDVHRHRMPPATAAVVARMRADGRLRVGTDELVDACVSEGSVRVTLASGRRLEVAAVVNCTGPDGDVRREAGTLVAGLVATGRAVPGPLGLGLRTRGGRLLDRQGSAAAPVFTLGALRRGELWESTAVPEIRDQAARLAGDVLAAAGARRHAADTVQPARRRTRDCMGEPLTTTREAAAAFDRGLQAVMRVQSGAAEAFTEAAVLDPGFALAHAALAMLGHEGGEDVDVTMSLSAARLALEHGATDRERSLVRVVEARVHDCRGTGARELLRHVGEHPRDVLAVSAAVPTIAFSGVTDIQQEAWDLVEGLGPAYAGHWWHRSLLAFVRQDQQRYDEAATVADEVLALEPAAGHAVHARAHVYYETGDHAAGLAWLDPWIGTCGRRATHRAHYSWHAALHELSAGDIDAVRRRYLAQLAPPAVTGVRGLVDSASLLWRCTVTGSAAELPPVDDVLRHAGDELVDRPATPFTAMHSAVALAAAGDAARLHGLRRHAATAADAVMREVVAPLCDGLTAVVDARWDDAVRTLRPLLPRLTPVGGSLAQREIVEDTYLFALVGAGRCEQAVALLDARLDRRPSPLDRRRQASLERRAGQLSR